MFLCRRRFYSDLRHLKKIGGQWVFGGASDFSNLLAPWASDSRSLMLRAEMPFNDGEEGWEIKKGRC